MTQSESIKAIAAATNKPPKEVKIFMAALASLSAKTIKKKDVLQFPGIGKLVSVHRKARMGRNPMTGEKIKIKAKDVVRFRITSSLRKAVLKNGPKKGK